MESINSSHPGVSLEAGRFVSGPVENGMIFVHNRHFSQVTNTYEDADRTRLPTGPARQLRSAASRNHACLCLSDVLSSFLQKGAGMRRKMTSKIMGIGLQNFQRPSMLSPAMIGSAREIQLPQGQIAGAIVI